LLWVEKDIDILAMVKYHLLIRVISEPYKHKVESNHLHIFDFRAHQNLWISEHTAVGIRRSIRRWLLSVPTCTSTVSLRIGILGADISSLESDLGCIRMNNVVWRLKMVARWLMGQRDGGWMQRT
jgi:hypothetical protein